MSAWTLFRETLRIARQALAANLMRSLLALLGIVIGVATVIAMMSLINGFQRSFERGIRSFGNNSIYIRTFRPGVSFSGQIPDSLRKRRAFSVADAALFYVTFWASGRMKMPLPKNVAAHYERMKARPAVKRTVEQEGLTAAV